MANFDKPIQDYTEEELLDRINHWDPRFGIIASYELMRRLSIKNARSSKVYALCSLTLAIIAIIITLITNFFN